MRRPHPSSARPAPTQMPGPSAVCADRDLEPAHDAGAQHEPRQLRIGAAEVLLLHLEVRTRQELAGVVAVAARGMQRREPAVVGAGGGHGSSLRVSRIDFPNGGKHDEPPRRRLRSASVWTLAPRGLRRALPRDLSPRARLRALDGVARGRRRRGRRDLRDRLAPPARHPAQRRAGLADRRHAPRPGQRAAQPPARRRAARAARPPAARARSRSRRPHRGRRAARRAAGALAAGPRGHRADGLVRPLQRRRRAGARHHARGVPHAGGASAPPAARRAATRPRPRSSPQWHTT